MKLVDGDNLLKAFVEARENYKADGNKGLFIDINAVIEIILKAPAVEAIPKSLLEEKLLKVLSEVENDG